MVIHLGKAADGRGGKKSGVTWLAWHATTRGGDSQLWLVRVPSSAEKLFSRDEKRGIRRRRRGKREGKGRYPTPGR